MGKIKQRPIWSIECVENDIYGGVDDKTLGLGQYIIKLALVQIKEDRYCIYEVDKTYIRKSSGKNKAHINNVT